MSPVAAWLVGMVTFAAGLCCSVEMESRKVNPAIRLFTVILICAAGIWLVQP